MCDGAKKGIVCQVHGHCLLYEYIQESHGEVARKQNGNESLRRNFVLYSIISFNATVVHSQLGRAGKP